MFEDILKKLNIVYRIEQNKTFVISNWFNFYLFLKIYFDNKIIPLSNHKERKQNLFLGFLDHSYTLTLLRYIKIFQKNKIFTIKQMAENLNIREDSVLSILRKERYSCFFNIEGRGRRGNPFKVCLTNHAYSFMMIYEKAKEVKDGKITL